MGRAWTPILACLAVAPVNAATYTVTTTNDSGVGSLRWAIHQANSHSGKDRILFDPSLSGAVIEPTTSLPAVTDPQTTINGDINSDGAPDIALDGANAGSASGITIRADDCSVVGLAITDFAEYGIWLRRADGCVIFRCHVGVDLPGTTAARNGLDQIYLVSSSNTMIGGTGTSGRNIIVAGTADPERSGIYIRYGSGNRIRNNNIGIARDGKTPFTSPDDSGVGITLDGVTRATATDGGGETPAAVSPTRFNTIGGVAQECNVFGGMYVGLDLRNAYKNHIRGNHFGLARNGRTSVPIAYCCIHVCKGSKNNWIMGLYDAPETRNVFSGRTIGVRFQDNGTQDNYLMRNYFGTNAAGTAQRPLYSAVVCCLGAGPQSITHNTIMARGCGIRLFTGAGSYVAHNRFGLYTRAPTRPITPAEVGVDLHRVGAQVVANDFRATETGVSCDRTPPSCLIVENKFRNCEVAVQLTGSSQANLGDLSNGTTQDDGGNRFYLSNTWFIRNETPDSIKAEGNRFPWPWFLKIHQRIWDRRDKPVLGAVDISPPGDVLSGSSAGSALALNGATAIPTTAGAEIVFSLSGSADVTATVLNIAGRPVRTICEARDCQAGTDTLVWNGQASNGLPVPNGRYLIRITARGDRGQSATALTALTLER